MARTPTTPPVLENASDGALVDDLLCWNDAARAVEVGIVGITAVGNSPGTARPGPGSAFLDGAGDVNLVDTACDAAVQVIVMGSSLDARGDHGCWLARCCR